MSLITPILTFNCCACAEPAASTTASAVKLKRRFIPFPPVGTSSCSDSEILMQLFEIGVQFGAGEAFSHTAVLHHIVAVGDGRGEPKVLLDQEDGEALLLQGADGLADLN